MPHRQHFQANATIEDELSEKNGYIARQPCKCCSSKNDTIEKLIDINKQQQETIHNLQAQNGELLTLLKRLSESPITNYKPTTICDPEGCCWTHGYKVRKGHTSRTCTTRAEGHQEKATCSNTMGGSNANKHWKGA